MTMACLRCAIYRLFRMNILLAVVAIIVLKQIFLHATVIHTCSGQCIDYGSKDALRFFAFGGSRGRHLQKLDVIDPVGAKQWHPYLSSDPPYSNMTPHLDVVWNRGWYNVRLPHQERSLAYHNAPGRGENPLSMGLLKQYFQLHHCGMIWMRMSDLHAWMQHILPRSECNKSQITLITSDRPDDVGLGKVADNILSSDKIAAWYSTNVIAAKPRLHPIPLGIPVHYGFDGSPHSAHTVQTMDVIRRNALPFRGRNRTVLLDIGTSGGSGRRSKGRALVQSKLLKCRKSIIEVMPKGGQLQSWPRYASHQFAIAPVGVGYDTFRFWEYLFFGTVPVVLSSPLDAMLKDAHVPCVIVKDWDEICSWTGAYYDALVNRYEKWIAKSHLWLRPSLWVPRNQMEMDRLCSTSPGCKIEEPE